MHENVAVLYIIQFVINILIFLRPISAVLVILFANIYFVHDNLAHDNLRCGTNFSIFSGLV